MKHTDVIYPQYIDDYVETHKILYRTLSKMISDISFIKACCDLQDVEMEYDWISIKYLHGAIFEGLILRTCKCFFDNSGKDATNLFGFKNSVIGRYLKEEYRDQIKNPVAALHIEDKSYKSKLNDIRDNCLSLRDNFIAHGLLTTNDNAVVDLNDIRELVDYGIELFQVLSFEPGNFYNWLKEGDGYDFSKEIAYTQKSLSNFIRYTMLSSKYISEVDCKISADCEASMVRKIEAMIKEINSSKKGST